MCLTEITITDIFTDQSEINKNPQGGQQKISLSSGNILVKLHEYFRKENE